MKTTPINAWPVAQDTDPVKQYPAAVDDPFKSSLDKLVMTPFATAAARDAAITSPVDGMLSWITDRARAERYVTGMGWVPEGGSWGDARPTANFTGIPTGWSRLSLVTLTQPSGVTDFSINNAGLRTNLAGRFALSAGIWNATANSDLVVAYTVNVVTSPTLSTYLARLQGVSPTGNTPHGHVYLNLAATDTVYLWGYFGGAAQTVEALGTYLSLQRVGHK